MICIFLQKNVYHDKKIMDELFHKYHLPLLKDIDHPKLITQWKQNLDASAYEKKATIK